MTDRITICSGCRPSVDSSPKGRELAEKVRSILGDRAEVALTDCMIVCGKPVTVSFRAEGKAAYLFSGVDPETQAEDIAAFAELYAAAPDGIIEDARPCGQLRFCLIGRIPA